MTTEEIVLDCSGHKKEGLVTSDDRGLTQKKIKYAFQVIRVDCRVKWKFKSGSPAEAGKWWSPRTELKFECGPTKKKKRKSKDEPRPMLTLASCGESSLEKKFALEPDGVHAIWKRKKKGTFYFKICICFL